MVHDQDLRGARRASQVAPAALLLLAASSCKSGPPAELVEGVPGKKWAVLIWMDGGDRDGASRAIQEMEQPSDDARWSAASTARADVVVELGLERYAIARAGSRTSTAGAGWIEPRSPVIAHLAEEALSPAERLVRFVEEGVRAHPAQHYLVVVRGSAFARDVPSVRAALAGAGRPIDAVAFDAPSMMTVEAVTELAGAARFVVGPAGARGLPFRALIPQLNGSADLAPAFDPCAADDEPCRLALGVAELAPSLAAADASRLAAEVPPALDALGEALAAYAAESPARRAEILSLASGPCALGGGVIDLGLFLERVYGSASASEPIDLTLLRAVAAARANLELALLSRAGIGVWMPTRAPAAADLASYERSRFAAGSRGWRAWVRMAIAAD